LKEELSADCDGNLLNKWLHVVEAAAIVLETKMDDNCCSSVMLKPAILGHETQQQEQQLYTTPSGNLSGAIGEVATYAGASDVTMATNQLFPLVKLFKTANRMIRRLDGGDWVSKSCQLGHRFSIMLYHF
jgi:hypothetical protein